MSLLDHPLYFFLQLIAVLDVMSFNFVEFASSTWFRPHNVSFWGWKSRDVLRMENLTPYQILEIVQRCEDLYRLSYSLECSFIFNKRGIVILPLVM